MFERLQRGSILNHRSFFLEENASISARASKPSIILEISAEELSSFFEGAPNFEKKYLSYQTKILNSAKTFPLDYILKVPSKHIIDPLIVTPERIHRMGVFKLVVMRRIQELRIIKSKPKLSDLLKDLKNGGPMQRIEVKRKILALYEHDASGEKEEEEN